MLIIIVVLMALKISNHIYFQLASYTSDLRGQVFLTLFGYDFLGKFSVCLFHFSCGVVFCSGCIKESCSKRNLKIYL